MSQHLTTLMICTNQSLSSCYSLSRSKILKIQSPLKKGKKNGSSLPDNRVNRLLCYCWLIAGVILELHNSFKEIFDIYEMTSIIN